MISLSRNKKFALALISFCLAVGLFARAPLTVCIRTYGPKHGQVVDADTGAGIPGVNVVVEGYYYVKGSWQSLHNCTYVQFVVTDKDGYYSLPSEYSHWQWIAPSQAPRFPWYTTVSKSGYAPANLQWPVAFDAMGDPNGTDPFESDQTTVKMNGLTIEVPPIPMKQVEPSIQDEIVLFHLSGIGKTCNRDDDGIAQMTQLVHAFFDELTAKTCAAPADASIQSSVVGMISIRWARNEDGFRRASAELFKSDAPSAMRRIPMTAICNALKAGD